MASKKTGGIFDNDEAQLTAKQWASSGLKKVDTVNLLKPMEPVKVIPKTGNLIGFSYNPETTNGLVEVGFNIQMGVDDAPFVHVEMCYSYNKDTDDLVTFGTNFDQLKFRNYKLADILHYIVILEVEDDSPFSEDDMQKAMEAYFAEKQKTVGRDYGYLSLAGGLLNQAMDFVTFGRWHKLSIINESNYDCSGTCADLVHSLWPAKNIRRKGQDDYIPVSAVSLGDLYHGEGIREKYSYKDK